MNKAIDKFPEFYEAYIYRAKIFVILKEYDKALQNFNKAIELNPQRGVGIVKKNQAFNYLFF